MCYKASKYSPYIASKSLYKNKFKISKYGRPNQFSLKAKKVKKILLRDATDTVDIKTDGTTLLLFKNLTGHRMNVEKSHR